ncbi:hypothetical protein D3C87_2061150 [compost metagenome]
MAEQHRHQSGNNGDQAQVQAKDPCVVFQAEIARHQECRQIELSPGAGADAQGGQHQQRRVLRPAKEKDRAAQCG